MAKTDPNELLTCAVTHFAAHPRGGPAQFFAAGTRLQRGEILGYSAPYWAPSERGDSAIYAARMALAEPRIEPEPEPVPAIAWQGIAR